MELLHEKLFQFFKTLLDGQRFYIGKDMYEVHKSLGITDHLFDMAGNILAETVEKLKPRPSAFVRKTFVDRVTALRSQIVIVQAANEDNKGEEKEYQTEDQTLFEKVGAEEGIKSIVSEINELAGDEGLDLTPIDDMVGYTCQPLSDANLRFPRFVNTVISEWFSSQRSCRFKSVEDDFEKIIGIFKVACRRNDVPADGIEDLIKYMTEHKDTIVNDLAVKEETQQTC